MTLPVKTKVGELSSELTLEQFEYLAWIATQLSDAQLAGMVHMAPMKLASQQWPDDASPSAQIALAAHGWFGLLERVEPAEFRPTPPGFVASVTALRTDAMATKATASTPAPVRCQRASPNPSRKA